MESILELFRSAVTRSSSIVEISVSDAQVKLDSLATKIGVDPHKRWWWESLTEARRWRYDQDGSNELLGRFIATADTYYIAITDDDLPPWPVFIGNGHELFRLILNLPFFEFVLFKDDYSFILFDTHNNELLVVSEGQ